MGPRARNGIAYQQYDPEVRQVFSYLLNLVRIHAAVVRRYVARNEVTLVTKQLSVTPDIHLLSGQGDRFRDKGEFRPVHGLIGTPTISAPRHPAQQFVCVLESRKRPMEVVDFLNRRHPEIRMKPELIEEPSRTRLGHPDTYEV